jgi:hypothetical protein
MAHHSYLPIWKIALSLAVHLEQAVRRFSCYHKYTLGQDLRHGAQRLCVRVVQANDATVKRTQGLVLAAQTGYYPAGCKQRTLVSLWTPSSPVHQGN